MVLQPSYILLNAKYGDNLGSIWRSVQTVGLIMVGNQVRKVSETQNEGSSWLIVLHRDRDQVTKVT